MVSPNKQANIHMHVSNKVTLVWGSLRLAPNSYIPPWGVVILHIGVGLHPTLMCKTTPQGGI